MHIHTYHHLCHNLFPLGKRQFWWKWRQKRVKWHLSATWVTRYSACHYLPVWSPLLQDYKLVSGLYINSSRYVFIWIAVGRIAALIIVKALCHNTYTANWIHAWPRFSTWCYHIIPSLCVPATCIIAHSVYTYAGEKGEGSDELVLKLLAIHDPMADPNAPINFTLEPLCEAFYK